MLNHRSMRTLHGLGVHYQWRLAKRYIRRENA
jgi:hypothetical protein